MVLLYRVQEMLPQPSGVVGCGYNGIRAAALREMAGGEGSRVVAGT